MSIYSLAYVSHSRLDDLTLDTRVEINSILEVARLRNATAGVTGALMFNEHMFTQVLEGEESAVRGIMSVIQRDPRHRDITILATGMVPYRSFTSWRMAFAGTSEVARTYYAAFAADRIMRKAITSQALCQLMLRMIALDESTGAAEADA